jgi:hypothetical protein
LAAEKSRKTNLCEDWLATPTEIQFIQILLSKAINRRYEKSFLSLQSAHWSFAISKKFTEDASFTAHLRYASDSESYEKEKLGKTSAVKELKSNQRRHGHLFFQVYGCHLLFSGRVSLVSGVADERQQHSMNTKYEIRYFPTLSECFFFF